MRIIADVYGILQEDQKEYLVCYCYSWRQNRMFLIDKTTLPQDIAKAFTDSALQKRSRKLHDEPVTLCCDMDEQKTTGSKLVCTNFSIEVVELSNA